YEAMLIDLSLKRGETVERDIALQPLMGEFVVKSAPSGATVTVNNEDMGKTPLTLPLNGGLHDVKIVLQKYETTNETIESKNSAPKVERNYRLNVETAGVNLNLQPTGGKLLLNGLRVDNTDRISVEADKPNSLTYSKPGYSSQTETFTLSTNEKITLDI